MKNIWERKFDIILNPNSGDTYIVSERLSINETQLLKNHDIHFKNQSCINGITYSYIHKLDNIYEKTLLTGNGKSINNMYSEYNIIDKHMENLHRIDIAIDTNIDISKKYFKLDNIELNENHFVLLFNKNNKQENDIYIINKNILVKTELLKTEEKTRKSKFYIKLGTYKEKIFFLSNDSIYFPISNDEKDFKIYNTYILKNKINYNLNGY